MKIIAKISEQIMRYAIVIILFWYGILKFTNSGAFAIESLISNSPILKYLYMAFSVRATSNIIGTIEVITAILIALQPFAKKIGNIGAILGAFVFLNTIIFLFTTPNIWKINQGILMPMSIANFIIKDLVFFGFCVWSIVNKK